MFPDYDQFLSSVWGWGSETVGLLPLLPSAANILVGTNPVFAATDFFAMYPWFGGTPSQAQGTLDGATGVVTGVTIPTGVAVGQLVAGTGIAAGSTILAFDSIAQTITLSKNTTAVGAAGLSIYTTLLVPLPILNAYIALASNCLQQVRWQEIWPFAMCLFVAHYLTLWLQSAQNPNNNMAQAAASGLAMGIKIAKAAGDVSVALKVIEFDGWGTYGLTLYGQQLITFGKALGSAGMLLV